MGFCPACKKDWSTPRLRYCPQHGLPLEQPDASAPPLGLVGQVVAGSYRVLEQIGVGGMGSIYRVEQLRLGKLMAMKVLHRDLGLHPEAVERFGREARLASMLVHPHCIELCDYGRAEDGSLFMVMEYLPGRDLFDVLSQEHSMTPARTVHIARQIASGLAEAHRHTVIHRDLKPENVFLVADREFVDYVKILDFGIAKALLHGPEDCTLTLPGKVFGTPEYLAPEQAAGEKVDCRADLYSLGIILYRMLSGRLPFQSVNKAKLMLQQRDDPPLPFRSLRMPQLVPTQLEQLVFRLLAKNPDARYQTADEVRQALEQVELFDWLVYR